MDPYPWLKALHIFFAIVAVGFNISYSVWQARAAREPQHMGYALRGIKFMDDRIANPAYVGLAVVGVILVFIGPYEFEQLWIAVSIGLYLALVVIGLFLYTPTLRNQIAAYESGGPESSEFTTLGSRGRLIGMVLGLIVVTIIILMVVKPGA